LPETRTSLVELLAPAGSPNALVAAVNNGADAVYLGLGSFNARRGADNFEIETLAEWVRFAHLRGARVYLTANIVVLPSEIPDALDLIDAAWAAGVDAVIVQDLGMLSVLKRVLPHVRVHASTQIDAMNAETVALLAEEGVQRVTLARELPPPAIAACAAAGVEVETFVHGALCYSYSGQCLMSSLIGQRSANRGLCAQPCRMRYELLDANGASVEVPGQYLLSTRDLAGIAQLPELIGAGVAALKIEGRMKSPEYVAIVTAVYRAALDRALEDPGRYEVLPSEWERLEEAFNRGFTEGYLTGERGRELMSYTRPNNRGVLVGRVASSSRGAAEVALERALDPADTLEFWTRAGRFAQAAGTLTVEGARVSSAPAGSTVSIEVERQVLPGDRVFRVANATLLDAARRTYGQGALADRNATPVDIGVTVRIGKPLSITVSAAGHTAEAQGDPVEAARTKAIGVDEIVEHVGRLGGSGYRAGSWEIDLEAGAGIGYSRLHAVRREALGKLDEVRLGAWADRRRTRPVPPPLPKTRPRGARTGAPAVVATAWDVPTAVACVEAGADSVWLRVYPGQSPGVLPAGVRPLLPRVVWPSEMEWALGMAEGGPFITGNLGLLGADGVSTPVEADWPLNAVNAYSVEALDRLGARLVWASPELSGRQLADVVASSTVPVGALVWGRIELMVAEQCVLMAAGACNRTCAACARRAGWWRLRDQKGYEFPVTTDPSGRSHILNSVTLDLSRALDEIIAAGVSAVRLDFSDEGDRRAAEVVRAFRQAVGSVAAGAGAPDEALVTPATSGHFYRGLR
jgi:putative protease